MGWTTESMGYLRYCTQKNEKYAIMIQGFERLLYIELELRSNHNLRCQYSLLFVALLALFLLDYSKNGFTLLA